MEGFAKSTWTKLPGLDGKRVIKIQCGGECSAILTDDGVYAMGSTLSSGAILHTPTRIELPDVVDISLGAYHILAKTANGQVYAGGDNKSARGACGVGTISHIDKPTRVPFPDDVTVLDISAGRFHSIFTCKRK